MRRIIGRGAGFHLFPPIYHLRTTLGVTASRRITYLADPDSFEERAAELYSTDPLGFTDDQPYPDRLSDMRAAKPDARTA